MRKTFFTILLFHTLLPLTAVSQKPVERDRSNRYFMMEFSAGPNMDIPPSSRHENAALLGGRPGVVPFFHFKSTHLFSDKFGWYACLQMNFYKEKKAEAYRPGAIIDFLESVNNAVFAPVAVIKPAVDAGFVYRIERHRWDIYPGLGVGYVYYAADRHAGRTRKNEEGQSIEWTYQQKASTLAANARLTVHYFLSPKSFLVLHAGYQQPLQSASASLFEKTDGVETLQQTYRTTSAGRNLSVGFGFGFILGKKRRDWSASMAE